jgi:glycosyltransferase involved in cell wall biosynthesis
MNSNEVEILAKRFPEDKHKIRAIHSFIMPVIREYAVERRHDGFSVVVMGAWLPFYSLEDVLEVMSSIAVIYPRQQFFLSLVLALFNIDFSYKQKILGQVAKLQEENPNLKIEILEDLEDTLTFLSGVDLLVRSSSVDSFGLCVAEALFLGKPVIATNVCRRADGAYLYAPHDLKKMQEYLVTIYEKTLSGTVEQITLKPEEDAFPVLKALYLNK